MSVKMADFDTVDYQNSLHSRQSSASSGHSYSSNKENGTSEHHTSVASEDLSSDASENQLILRDGVELKGESRTDVTQSTFVYENMGLDPTNKDVSPPNSKLGRTLSAAPPGTAKAKVAKSPFSSTPISPIAEEEITIPNDANLSHYTSDQLANFLKCLKVDDRIVAHLHNKSVDGKRFARLKDSELESLGMKNPVVVYFRDKSNVKVKRKGKFML